MAISKLLLLLLMHNTLCYYCYSTLCHTLVLGHMEEAFKLWGGGLGEGGKACIARQN